MTPTDSYLAIVFGDDDEIIVHGPPLVDIMNEFLAHKEANKGTTIPWWEGDGPIATKMKANR